MHRSFLKNWSVSPGLYKEKNGFEELARRYLNNIVNGRWMWRNRYATDKQVIIREADQTETAFSVKNRLDVDYSGRDGFDVLAEKNCPGVIR